MKAQDEKKLNNTAENHKERFLIEYSRYEKNCINFDMAATGQAHMVNKET